jgi:uncharacterized protein
MRRTAAFCVAVLLGYPLPLLGTHGVSHWGRVLETGRNIEARSGADPAVIEYFAIFHDALRENETDDPDHGRHGAELAERLRSGLDLSEAQMEELKYACVHHTSGLTEGSVTVRTCWDSDRLDLWRVGIQPEASFLCTEAAMDTGLQEWTEKRSVENFIPQCSREWLRLLEEEF